MARDNGDAFLQLLDSPGYTHLRSFAHLALAMISGDLTIPPDISERVLEGSVPHYRPLLCPKYRLAAAAAAKSLQSCPTLCDPIDGSSQAPPSLGFSRQEHWSGLPFPSPMHESGK